MVLLLFRPRRHMLALQGAVYYWFGYHGFDKFFTVVCSGTVGFLAALSGVAPIQVFVEPGVSY
jgi:hypothetical protein